ncbi:MAG: histidine--tRNA ligase [Candidatus Dojkabacteria bacterium]|nr:histidine--tRNA ligase [Candidatus Dojkabacteria bacterium]
MNTKVLPGFQELLPNEQLEFNRIKRIIEDAYLTYGYRPIETPVLERAEVLLSKSGGETEKQIYQFEKGDTKLAMRFDLTVPLARYVAQHQNDLVFPFKRYAIDKVYRGEKPQAGRFREFYQCDIDVIGRDTLPLEYDAQIPLIISEIFTNLKLDFTIRINNRKILNGFLQSLGLKDIAIILNILDGIEREGEGNIKKELIEINVDAKTIKEIFTFIQLNKLNNSKLIKALKDYEINSDMYKEGVGELSFVYKKMKEMGIKEKNCKIDLSVVRGLDYYTGTVYETTLNKYPEIGSVCSGGRYDDLASYYTSNKFPGVGISIGLTRLFDQLLRRGAIDTAIQTNTKVLVISLCDDDDYINTLLEKFQESNIAMELGVGDLKKNMTYANRLKIPYVVIIGEDEIKAKKYTIKDMDTGKQQKKTLKGILGILC